MESVFYLRSVFVTKADMLVNRTIKIRQNIVAQYHLGEKYSANYFRNK